jgi:hypothetical protein
LASKIFREGFFYYSRFRVQGSGFRVQRFRVQGFNLKKLRDPGFWS